MHFLSQKLARAAGLLVLGVTSQAHSASAYECFGADGHDLQHAVHMYSCCPALVELEYDRYGPMEDWCTKFVTTMDNLFQDKPTFNVNITAWDTSSVTTMFFMFKGASAFNQDISGWNISKVTTMIQMFKGASAFNQNLCAWKDDFPYDGASSEVFSDSGCTYYTYPSTPLLSNKGPFCAGSAKDCRPEPSDLPSNVPSDVPSDLPSIQPSNVPSDLPSNVPSDLPSSQPSDLPSSQPSNVPSDQPSSEPSSTPSCSPSASPTESPSTKFGVNLFYPEWTAGNIGCRNDGDEPDYMAVNATQWLSSTMQACCKKYFGGYMYDACMGRYPPDHDDCNVMLYYPDWNGSNEKCLDDGKEPYYMLSNHQLFFSNSIEECCEKFYEWDFYECSGTTPELTHGEFYPDWSGGGSTCLADGKIPDYMISNQKWYLSTTLEKCCERHFYWDINECLGTEAVGTDKWYVNYEDEKCVQDCSGGASSCGGVANFWEELYSTKEQCCKNKLSWVSRCRFK